MLAATRHITFVALTTLRNVDYCRQCICAAAAVNNGCCCYFFLFFYLIIIALVLLLMLVTAFCDIDCHFYFYVHHRYILRSILLERLLTPPPLTIRAPALTCVRVKLYDRLIPFECNASMRSYLPINNSASPQRSPPPPMLRALCLMMEFCCVFILWFFAN